MASCNDTGTAPPARVVKPTSPVTGRVLVDGRPVEKLLVTTHNVQELGAPTLRSLGLTDADGVVTFSTYEASDGVPAGEYVLTFEWRDWNDYWDRLEGPDKLGDRYSEPEKSEYRLNVTEGEPADLGTIELTTE